MATNASNGVRNALGLIVLPLGAAAAVALVLGGQVGRPAWWLAGLAAGLHALALVRVTAALRHGVDDPVRIGGVAGQLEPLVGLLAVLGGLWGLLTPPAGHEAPPLVLGGLLALAAVSAAVGGRYAESTPDLPEGPALGRWSRLTVWAAALVVVDWALIAAELPQPALALAASRALLAVCAVLGVQVLVGAWPRERPVAPIGGIDPGALRWFFGRWNPLASVGDAVQAGLGIDLRATWAIQFVRSAVEPMALVVGLLGWLSTGLVRVGPEELAIHERLGVPSSTTPLGPGLHVVVPWPVDRVRRVPAQRVLTMAIGEEEEEEEEGAEHEGPEDTLWARMHAEEEYTLLLGDGNDLVTIDGLLHYRISDPYTYLYGAQNPEDGLRSAAYEALTRRTVGRSLDGVLSENLSAFADEVVAEIQLRATELDLGLEPVSFTLKGLHPPFGVAKDYQAVVSAQIARETAVIRANAYRLRQVPSAETQALLEIDEARAVHAKARGTAVGEAEAFRALVDSYVASPDLFRFRRRMETLEYNLAERELTIVDRRFEAEGGHLWVLQ
ncbi:MAG: regulator of protease activity HflC (stomatin/prohibitin superfamily) [Myxococcota bacterium]|jgi:regulator of protease activity HflC (stomatin/prohibitin superfamily)